jgi:glycerate-2-kinase
LSDRETLLELYRVALGAVDARLAVERSLRADPLGEGPVTVLAVGKAACGMAEGALAVLGNRIREGRVVTKEGHGRPVGPLEVEEAGHPLPDDRSARGAASALKTAERLGSEDILLLLISGGASSLWASPAEGFGLDEKRRVTEMLLRAGVDIAAFNAVRKHLSRIKGGRLAQVAHPARVSTLAISDVRGDRVDIIGSGPTAPDPTTFADAIRVLREAGLFDDVPSAVRRHLAEGADGRRLETPKAGDPVFGKVEHQTVSTLDDALQGVSREAESRGLRVWSLGACLYGVARDEAQRLALEIPRARERGVDLLIAGGEPTVRVEGGGRGGRAQEAALAFALAISGEMVTGLFAGTDGTDGPTDAAGALVDGETVARARRRGLDPRGHLDANDSYPLLEATGDLIRTGPTDTNVTDLALIRIPDSS